MNKFKLKSIVVAAVATSALTFGSAANATTTVWDYANGILIAAQTAMQSYMIGLTNSGVDMVASNQAKQSQVQESLVKMQIKHDALREDASYIRQISKESQAAVVEAANQTAPSVNGCVQRTMSEAVIATGVTGSRSTGGIADKLIRTRANTVGDIDNWGNKLLSHNQDASLCSELDMNRATGRKNLCGGSGEGIRADADKRIGSIFAAAGTGETIVFDDKGKPRVAENVNPHYTMDKQAQDIARKVIDNITTGSKPPLLSVEAENTPAGRGYVAMTRVHDARILAATSALADIAEKRAQPEESADASGLLKKSWEKIVFTWFKLNPTRKGFTGLPSQFELMNTRINRAETTEYYDALMNLSSENVMREQIHATYLNTKVNWMVYQQLERITAIQAASLAHSMEPITADSMKATREAAMRGKN